MNICFYNFYRNVKDCALSNQTRLSRYFTQKYFKPDKILTLRKIVNNFDWRCFYGEFKPTEYSSPMEHPDFMKILVLLRNSLKELTHELLFSKKLELSTQCEMYGSLTGGNKICFLKLVCNPYSKLSSYRAVYSLYISKWYNFTQPNDIAEIMVNMLKMCKCWLDLNFDYHFKNLAQTIETTPEVSVSLSTPSGALDMLRSNIV